MSDSTQDLDTIEVLQLLEASFVKTNDPDVELARILPQVNPDDPRSVMRALDELVSHARRD